MMTKMVLFPTWGSLYEDGHRRDVYLSYHPTHAHRLDGHEGYHVESPMLLLEIVDRGGYFGTWATLMAPDGCIAYIPQHMMAETLREL